MIKILRSREIPKIAANLKFEQRWSIKCLGTRIRRWVWDTVEAAHVLDNRRGKITGVKFQTFVRFGLIDYSSHLDQYIKTPKEAGANEFNRIQEAPMRDLLVYNAIDAMVEFRLAKVQRGEMK